MQLKIASQGLCPERALQKSWQRTLLTRMKDMEYPGVSRIFLLMTLNLNFKMP